MNSTSIERKVSHRAVCRWHRWYGPWRTVEAVAVADQARHEVECRAELDGWSPEVVAAWDRLPSLAGTPVTLTPASLAALSNAQRLAVLAGAGVVAGSVVGDPKAGGEA